VTLSVVRAIGDENWTKLESEILPLSLKVIAAQLVNESGRGVRGSRLDYYEDYLNDVPKIRMDDTIPPYSSFDVKAAMAYKMYDGTVKAHFLGVCSHSEDKLELLGPSSKNGLPLLKCLSCGDQMYGYLAKEPASQSGE
jgi:hypothetical protein